MFKSISRKACLHRLRVALLRHPPSAAEASGGGTRYSFSARGRQSKAGSKIAKFKTREGRRIAIERLIIKRVFE